MKKLTLNGLIDVNCYIINNKDKCYIIDPGSELNVIKEAVKDYEVLGILLTHGHVDHIGEIGEFNCPIYIHELDYRMLFDSYLSCFDFLDSKPKFDPNKLNIIKIKDNDIIKLNNDTIKVIHTPGHTLGSVCYLYNNTKLFSGDTLFYESVGRTDLPNASLSELKKSVVHLISSLSESIDVYPGHEENTTIKNEKKNNQFYLRYKK